MSIPFQFDNLLSFISLYFGTMGDIEMFIVHLLVQTVQCNTKEPTNNYDLLHSVLGCELICYASLIKAPNSHKHNCRLINIHELIVWGSLRCVSVLIRHMHPAHFSTNVVQALVECINSPLLLWGFTDMVSQPEAKWKPTWDAACVCVCVRACVFVCLTSFCSCLILHRAH